MPLIAGMFSSIGPGRLGTPHAPCATAWLYAAAASPTRNAMAQMDGPCTRANDCANESGSALTMKLISPCRYSSTFFERWRAIAVKPICSNRWPSAAGSGAAYSMNSKPSVPRGFSQSEGVVAAMVSVRKRQGADSLAIRCGLAHSCSGYRCVRTSCSSQEFHAPSRAIRGRRMRRHRRPGRTVRRTSS